jgi:hypothetical protein
LPNQERLKLNLPVSAISPPPARNEGLPATDTRFRYPSHIDGAASFDGPDVCLAADAPLRRLLCLRSVT